MSFLPDVCAPCEESQDKRFNRDTLAVAYGGKSNSKRTQLGPFTWRDCRQVEVGHLRPNGPAAASASASA